MIELLRTLLFVSVGVGLVTLVGLAIASVWFGASFGNYLRDRHPPLWNELVPPLHVRLGRSRPSARVASYRRRPDLEIADPELRRRRDLANRSEWWLMFGFLGLCGWTALATILLATLG